MFAADFPRHYSLLSIALMLSGEKRGKKKQKSERKIGLNSGNQICNFLKLGKLLIGSPLSSSSVRCMFAYKIVRDLRISAVFF
jgi:hypothetical protein